MLASIFAYLLQPYVTKVATVTGTEMEGRDDFCFNLTLGFRIPCGAKGTWRSRTLSRDSAFDHAVCGLKIGDAVQIKFQRSRLVKKNIRIIKVIT